MDIKPLSHREQLETAVHVDGLNLVVYHKAAQHLLHPAGAIFRLPGMSNFSPLVYASHLLQVQQLLVRLLPAMLALLRPTLQHSTAGSGDFLSPSGTEPFDVHIPGFCLKLVSAELISSDSAA